MLLLTVIIKCINMYSISVALKRVGKVPAAISIAFMGLQPSHRNVTMMENKYFIDR